MPVTSSTPMAISVPCPKRRAIARSRAHDPGCRARRDDHRGEHQLPADEERHRDEMEDEDRVPHGAPRIAAQRRPLTSR